MHVPSVAGEVEEGVRVKEAARQRLYLGGVRVPRLYLRVLTIVFLQAMRI